MDSLNSLANLNNNGHLIQSKNHFVFWGNQGFSLKDLRHLYPQISVLNQVHGNKLVKGTSNPQVADGHWTDKKNFPLVIKTADCMPLFIYTPSKIFALHAGWRGVAQKILSQTRNKIENFKEATLYIGPHIHSSSFQLDKKSTLELLDKHKLNLNQAKQKEIITDSFSQKDHYHCDLSQLLLHEAKELHFKDVIFSPVNTFTSSNHYSHRRNRWRIGQNLSFIVNI